MRFRYATPAIVLRTRPYGESDKIVSFLTENHGKITGIAKGAKRSRKRFVNSLETFSLVELRFQDRPHGSLVFVLASDLLCGFRNLASSLEKIAFASYLVEITDGLIGERDENPLVFQHLKSGLNFLENNPSSLMFLIAFELKLLRLTGYKPSLGNCIQCAKERDDGLPVRWNFSPKDGGIFCQRCSETRREILPIGPAALTALADLQEESKDFSSRVTPSSSVLKEIRSIIVRFIQFHMDRDINSASFLYQFCAL